MTMTDGTNNNGGNGDDNGAPVLGRQARLNALLNKSVSFAPTQEARVEPSHRNLRYNTATDTFTDLDTQETFKASELPVVYPGDDGRDIPDDNRNLDADWANYQREWQQRFDKLNEVRYDPITGAKSYVLQGPEREQFEKEFMQFHEAMEYQAEVLRRLKQQRARKKQEQTEAFAADAEREERIAQRALERAEEIEAEERARAILASRRAGY